MRSREFIFEAPLGPGLFKYEQNPRKDRVPTFLEKIIMQEPFTIKHSNGQEEKVVFDPEQYEEIAKNLEQKNTKFKLKTLENPPRLIPFGAIVKTKRFGGELAGQREKIEQGQIGDIAEQLEKAKAGKPYVMLKVGKKFVEAAGVIKTPELVGGRAPKSDMSVIDPSGKAVAWVSLKGRPFRWGGWNHLSNLPEIAGWLQRIREETNGVFGPGQSYGLHISDDIARRIIFGKDFPTGKPGISNVDSVLVGEVSVTPTKGGFVLGAETEYKNGEVPTGQDAPYIVMRYMLGRPDIGFKNARAETNTKSETRKVKWLDNPTTPAPKTKEPAPVPASIQNRQKSLGTKIPMGSAPIPKNG